MVEPTKPEFHTTLDRAGWAIAAGGLLGGAFATLLASLGGVSPVTFALILVLGTCGSALAIVTLAGPFWLLCHRRRWRGPFAAAAVGAIAGFVLFLAGQTYFFGLYDMPITDDRTLAYRWLSGVATSAVLAFVTGAIGLAMWRVAYRREA